MCPHKSDTQRPAAFLDRDGTLIAERNFLGDPNAVEVLPSVPEAVRLLNQWGYWVIGVSNQSGVARTYFGIEEVESVNQRIIDMLAADGARLDRIYYCPHHPEVLRARNEEPCECRKPALGMIRRACTDFPIDLGHSFVVGDQTSDLGLARSAGIPGVLVLTGFGQWQREHLPADQNPNYIADDLLSAVRWYGRQIGRIDSATL